MAPGARKMPPGREGVPPEKEGPRPAGRPPARSGRGDPPGCRFPPRLRLRVERDFRLCYSRGVRVRGEALLLVVRRNGLAFSRLGLSIPRRFGLAPRRNRMKRICREAFRQIRRDLPPGLDMVVVGASSREAPLPSLRQAMAELRALAPKAERRLAERARQGPR